MTTGERYTIQDALRIWFEHPLATQGFEFRDDCTGLYCNEQCPEMFILDELTSNNWSDAAKIILVLILLGIVAMCVVLKAMFMLWRYRLEKKQHLYLVSLDSDLEKNETRLQVCFCMQLI